MTKTEIIQYINNLKGYRGYVQFSHRPIEFQKDLFLDRDPSVEEESGFVYEAHFANETTSIMIRQINDTFVITETDISTISDEEVNTFVGIGGLRVKMAQFWEAFEDPLCEGFVTPRLNRVVFAGFEGEKA